MRSVFSDAGDVIHSHPIFLRDTSKYWYKPTISREEGERRDDRCLQTRARSFYFFVAIAILKDKEPGTFVVRDSNSFQGAFGLALKVAQAPAGVAAADGTELVRHFLIEPSPKGVKLKGCANEPIFRYKAENAVDIYLLTEASNLLKKQTRKYNRNAN